MRLITCTLLFLSPLTTFAAGYLEFDANGHPYKWNSSVTYKVDLGSLGDIPKADPDILLKGNLAAGEMYDLLRKRDAALAKYQAVIAADSGSSYAETARKYLKEEYRE